jgi:hypothetical protein
MNQAAHSGAAPIDIDTKKGSGLGARVLGQINRRVLRKI